MQSHAHAHVLITATHPRFRRIGLAEAVKRQLHAFGASRGVERFTTVNEASNEAIRRLNATLGYRRISGAFRVRRSP
jgi:RimJ/RimL family protein N-acetyltransferase